MEPQNNSGQSSPHSQARCPPEGKARCILSTASRAGLGLGRRQFPHSTPSDIREQAGALHGTQMEMKCVQAPGSSREREKEDHRGCWSLDTMLPPLGAARHALP